MKTISEDVVEFTRQDGGKTQLKRRTVTSVSQLVDGDGVHITRKDGPPIIAVASYEQVVAWWRGVAA